MEPTEKKSANPAIMGILFVTMLALTAVLYFYKDRIIPDINAPYQEVMAGYIEAPATVVSKESKRGRKGPQTVITVIYQHQNGKSYTSRLRENAWQFVSEGDIVTVYYNPEKPTEVTSDHSYKEVMKGHKPVSNQEEANREEIKIELTPKGDEPTETRSRQMSKDLKR